MHAVSVAYEPASQRRHYRLTTPAAVIISGNRYATEDWSLGGFRIGGYTARAEKGQRMDVQFAFDFQGFEIVFPALAEVVRTAPEMLAAKFVDLGEREASLLKHFETSILGGQIAPVDKMLVHMDRPVTPISTGPKKEGPSGPGKHSFRRFAIASFYLAAGLVIGGFLLLAFSEQLTRMHIDTAVVGAPLEQVVSKDLGSLTEVYVQPGASVTAGQPLLRVDNELIAREVDAARHELDAARIDLKNVETKRRQEFEKLEAYKAISKDQLELSNAHIRALAAERDSAQTELARTKKLLENGIVAVQVYDTQAALLAEREANLQRAIAEQKIALTSTQTTNAGFFFSGNFLVGDMRSLEADEAAARERVAVAETALHEDLGRVAQRVYRAPFDGFVARVFKSAGMSIERGEPLVILRRNNAEPYIDAYLTQDDATYLKNGSRGIAYIPSLNRQVSVEIVAIDRTAGFLKEMQTPKILQPQYNWRGIKDPSAYARLAIIGPRDDLTPGLPVRVNLPKHRRWFAFDVLTKVYADSSPQPSSAGKPLLWPADSPLFNSTALAALQSNNEFRSVRENVLAAADRALRTAPAPMETLHSSGVTAKDDPELQRSRRAFDDADHFVLLALAHSLTGKTEYLNAAQNIIQAWATVNRPTGQPIDDTRLEGFLWGLDLMHSQLRHPAVKAWLGRWQAANRSWHFGPKTAENNHKTHHLKILLMLDRLLGDDSAYRKDLAEAEHHLTVNLAASDGSSLDYHERDALHYHVFDLEAWTEIALVTGIGGDRIDRAFAFLRKAMTSGTDHVEFAHSTAPIDRKRAEGGFEYAKPHTYDFHKAARLIFSYATLPGRNVDPQMFEIAKQGLQPNNLFYRARMFLWRTQS